MKKVLSLVLVIAMVLSSMSFAFASTFEDVTGDYEKAVDALASLDVIDGYEDGTFRPEKTITRAELAKVLVVSLGYGELVAGANSSFSDTQNHWANGYVAIAAGTGLVVGYPNGTFQPDKAVSYDEALTMVVRALGYTDAALKGTWPTNYKVKAIDLELTDDVAMKTTAADRGGVAQIIYNALDAALVEVNENNEAIKVTDAKNVVQTLLDKIATYEPAFEVTPDVMDPEEKTYAGDKVDLAPYMYQSLKVYLNGDDEVVFVKGTNNLVLEGKLNGVDDISGSSITVEDANEDNYKFTTSGTAVMVNGEETDLDDAEYVDSNVKVTVVINAANNDRLVSDKYTVKGIVAEKQTDVVQIANEYVTGKSKIDGIALPVDSDDDVDLDKITVTGDAESLEDIAENDIVVVYAGKNATGKLLSTKLVVSRDTVEGKVTRLNVIADKADNIYVDGVKYTESITAGNSVSVDLGAEGVFYLDHEGKIVAFEGTASAAKYAVVKGVEEGTLKEAFGKTSIKDYPQIKLATEDNEVVVYDVFVKLNSDEAVSDSATYTLRNNTTGDLFAGDKTGLTTLTSAAFEALDDTENLVSYKLNKAGQIIEIKEAGTVSANFNEDLSSYVFADDAVIFNGNDADFAVVGEDRLESYGTGTIAYNKDGKIAAMLTDNVKSGSTKVYGYVDTINAAYENDEEVQVYVAYLNGEKVEYLADANNYASVEGSVYGFELDGEVITGVDSVVTSTAITVSAISTSTNSLVVGATSDASVAAVNSRLFLTENATILEVSGETEEVIDLYDIKDQNVTVYFDENDDVVFIKLVK